MEKITHAMRRENWKRIVQECNESGMPKNKWLEMHGINSKSFYMWQSRLRMEIGTEMILAEKKEITENAPRFSLLELPDNTEIKRESIAVVKRGKISIELKEDISDAFLLRILKAASHV